MEYGGIRARRFTKLLDIYMILIRIRLCCFEQTKHVLSAVIVIKGFGGVGFILGRYDGENLLVINHIIS